MRSRLADHAACPRAAKRTGSDGAGHDALSTPPWLRSWCLSFTPLRSSPDPGNGEFFDLPTDFSE
jgi:hypothetical protein